MTILGINPYHNGSVCVLLDGEILEYIEEERLTRKKQDELPFKSILYVLNKYKIDSIAIAGINLLNLTTPWHKENLLYSFFTKLGFSPSSIFDFSNIHHTTHAVSAHSNSGFKQSIGIIIDSGGSLLKGSSKVERDSLFYCSYPNNYKAIYQNFSYSNIPLSSFSFGIGKSFEELSKYLGFSPLDGGKIMGLSSYGKSDNNLPNIFKGNNSNIEYLNAQKGYKDFFPKTYSIDWHYDESKITNLEKDLAWKVQNETQTILGNYVEKAIQETKLNNIVIAGGYGLNCVANYYLKKRFPRANFYFDPISHDGGTAIGAAKLLWHQKSQDTTIRPLKSLYLGPKYSKEELLEGIKKYVDTPQ